MLVLFEVGMDELVDAEDHVTFQRVLKRNMARQLDADALMDKVHTRLSDVDNTIREQRDHWRVVCEENQCRRILRDPMVKKHWGGEVPRGALEAFKKRFLRYVVS